MTAEYVVHVARNAFALLFRRARRRIETFSHPLPLGRGERQVLDLGTGVLETHRKALRRGIVDLRLARWPVSEHVLEGRCGPGQPRENQSETRLIRVH